MQFFEQTGSNTDILFDRFRIEKSLGVGGTSTVYLVTDLEQEEGELLALKVLHPGILSDNKVAKRFQRELLATYRVTHSNVIRAYEFLRNGSRVGYTMEYVPGSNLRAMMNSEVEFSISEVTKIAFQLVSGLSAIHLAGIFHRDLRPKNILIGVNDQLKIVDFGIARMLTSKTITRKDEVLASVEYSSPEFLIDNIFDHRSDIFSLGLIIYELLVGPRNNFEKPPLENLELQLNEELEFPSKIRQDCPKVFDFLIDKMCRENPDERFQSCEEILEFFAENDMLEENRPLEATKVSWNSKLWVDMNTKSKNKIGFFDMAVLGFSLVITAFCFYISAS